MEMLMKRWEQYSKDNPDFKLLFFIFCVLILLVIVMAIANPAFLAPRNLMNIMNSGAVYLVMGVGMTLILTTGGIDISTSSTIGLSTTFIGTTMMLYGFPFWVAIIAGLFVGFLVGCVNATFIVYAKVPPIIATLGAFAAVRGLANWYLGGQIYYNFPEQFVWIARGRILGIPVPVLIGLIVFIWGHYFLTRTASGRYIVALGGNEAAARLAGINVNKYRFFVYAFTGTMCGLAAIILAARLNSASSVIGAGMELHTIAVVVIGGTSLFGGRGLMIGTLFGVLILGVLENGLLLAGVDFFAQRVLLGFLFVLVVAVRTFRGGELAV